MTSTIDPIEVEKFSRIADEWWNPNGKFKPLHKFNPIRITYIKEKIAEKFSLNSDLKILDIGCGGGLVAEPFASFGASITAIDASEKNIAVAKIHAEKSGLKIDYRATSAEELAAKNEKFDVVLALEIIEHVADVEKFVTACASLVKPNGLLFIATINRNIKSLALAKIAVEYVLRWLPAGTHDWKKFLKPSEINKIAAQNNLTLQKITGFTYNIFNDSWKRNDNDLDVNYAMIFKKS
ncbi:MAG: bifunctional 2-polyprenyl-6-hydroxyphenol methylase/3-demethylubiquinol 3-O-methyltransferase UbiG [Proteobacteria bacterium]|nr:bifunctional 2-polyprenyl-6-hydroxyphenol methylase/3-demethylubiquinol 3-O-methyltransferase UbiG [Pseudomonadota bacterium]